MAYSAIKVESLIIMKVKSFYNVAMSLVVAIFAYTYFLIFQDSLIKFSPESPFVGVDSFVIIDTYIYYDVVVNADHLLGIMISAVKNTIFPSFIWYITGGNWLLVLAFNVFIYYMVIRYIIILSGMLNVEYRNVILLTTLAPATFYFMIGSLKELPTMLFMLGFFVSSIKKNYTQMVTFAALMTLLRYQLIAPIILYYLITKLSSEKAIFPNSVIVVIAIAALFPVVKDLNILSNEATEIFRQDHTGAGFGSIIEYVRDNIPFASSIAVLLRVIQTIIEPILYFYYSGRDNDVISIYPVVSAISLMLFSLHILKFIVGIAKAKVYRTDGITQRLYAYITLLIVPTAGFSFIHHRYIYPMYPLMAIASLAYSQNKRDEKNSMSN